MSRPSGYSEVDNVPCPHCEAPLDIDWVDVTGLGQRPRSEFMPGSLTCPKATNHDLGEAYLAMRLVRVAHPDYRDTCFSLFSRLDFWRERSWYPVGEEYQTPTERVEERVRLLNRQTVLSMVGDTP